MRKNLLNQQIVARDGWIQLVIIHQKGRIRHLQILVTFWGLTVKE